MTGHKGPDDYQQFFKLPVMYSLKYRRPIVQHDLMRFDRSMTGMQKRRVRYHCFSERIHVSTVFLSVSHGYDINEKPILFETAIITAGDFDIIGRASTWRNALKLHRYALIHLKDNPR